MLDGKKILYSAECRQPSEPDSRNYLGALKNWVTISDDYQTFSVCGYAFYYCPSALRQSLESAQEHFDSFILPPDLTRRKTAFITSPMYRGHAELAWILNCFYLYGRAEPDDPV